MKRKFSILSNKTLALSERSLEFIRRGKVPQPLAEELKLAHFDSFLLGCASLGGKSKLPSLLKHNSVKNSSLGSKSRSFMGKARIFGSDFPAAIEMSAPCNVASSCDIESYPTLGSGFPLPLLCVMLMTCQGIKAYNGTNCIKGLVLLVESFMYFDRVIGHNASPYLKAELALGLAYGSMLQMQPEKIQNALGLIELTSRKYSEENEMSSFQWALTVNNAIRMTNYASLGMNGPSSIIEKLGDSSEILNASIPIQLSDFSSDPLPINYRAGVCSFEVQSFIYGFYTSLSKEKELSFREDLIKGIKIRLGREFANQIWEKVSLVDMGRQKAQKNFRFLSNFI